MLYPEDIQNLVDEFSKFPSIGPKTAQRFVFYLLRKGPQDLERFVLSIRNIKDIKPCSICGNFSDQKICLICRNKNRSGAVIALVAEPQDLMAIEKIGEYKGTYHVLGGLLNRVAGIGPDQIRIKELIKRLREPRVKELIFALNSTMEGESTMLYITNLIKQDKALAAKLKLTKIARGLPLGSEIEYADEITLSSALKERKVI